MFSENEFSCLTRVLVFSSIHAWLSFWYIPQCHCHQPVTVFGCGLGLHERSPQFTSLTWVLSLDMWQSVLAFITIHVGRCVCNLDGFFYFSCPPGQLRFYTLFVISGVAVPHVKMGK